MARQASELRPAVPFSGVDRLEHALDAITFDVVCGGHVMDWGDAATLPLDRDRFLGAQYRLTIEAEIASRRVERALEDVRIGRECISFLCYANSPTLKQTVLLHPRSVDGRVLLVPFAAADDLPPAIEVAADEHDRLFRDVGAGFDVTYGFVLNADRATADPLTPKVKATWLARRRRRIRVVRRAPASYEITPLTDELRDRFGLAGRPLFYVRQIDDALSPLHTKELHDVVDIYVDDDTLPRLQASRPGAATRFIAAQMAVQVFTTIIQLGLLEDDDEAESGSVFSRAVGFLRGRDERPTLDELRSWAQRDPGRIHAEVQARMDQVSAAEALLT